LTMEDIPLHESLVAQLAALGEITTQAMFGGVGLYWQGVIFGIVFHDRLYLKVDEGSRGDYLARGMEPFRPNERQTLKAYYEVPPDVIMGDEILLSWVKEAMRAGQAS
jgi:DNA transformation protein